MKVLEQQPLPRTLFTQGLEIRDDKLYLSTGHYGKSKLLRYQLPSGKLEAARALDKRLFAEGLTVLKQRVYQLTWRAKIMLIYDEDTLLARGSHRLPGEGWGLTNDGQSLIFSDGSAQLHFMSPDSGEVLRSIRVTENALPVARLNELEWINGEIWANVWLTNRIVIIEPESGEVTASIDLEGLLPETERRLDTDVLNGIAFDARHKAIWVTGKRWPWRYRIALVPPPREKPQPAGVSR